MKDSFESTKHFVMRLPELTKEFLNNSILGFLVETKSLGDAFIYIKYWAFIWGIIFKFVGTLLFKRGPVGAVRELRQYPWILRFLSATKLLRRLTRGRKGAYLESNALVIQSLAVTLVETIEEIVLIFMYDEWVADIKGIYWALKDKRRQTIKE